MEAAFIITCLLLMLAAHVAEHHAHYWRQHGKHTLVQGRARAAMRRGWLW